MPHFSANLSFLYPEITLAERFAAAKNDGFAAVEVAIPYALPVAQLVELVERLDLELAVFNLPAGNWDSGERGIGCLPDRVEEFKQGVSRAVEYARATGCKTINCLAGIAPASADQAELQSTFVQNLDFAAETLGAHGVRLVMEPINRRDIPGFFLTHLDHAEKTIEQLRGRVGLQFDFYHVQLTQGDLIPTFRRLRKQIDHIQIADNPGRHKPGTGEINYRRIFEEIDASGYDGWVGCEYKPSSGKGADIAWRLQD
jgi:hydroxypyruvate isomerase